MAAIASRSFARALRNSCNRAVPSPICRLNTCSRAPMIRPAAHPRYPTARFYSSESSSGGRTSRSNFSSGPSKPPAQDHGHGLLYMGIGLATLAGGYGAYLYKPDLFGQGTDAAASKGPFVPKFEDYHRVYDAVAKRLQDHDEYDDGSYGPVILRLAWHASGTYDQQTGTGGSNGATMRFAPEGDHGANSGLKAAQEFLQPMKAQFPWISYSDLWILAGICAIQEMQGPHIGFRPGRQDRDVSFCTPDGRLPDGAKDQNHIRAIFGRMGFSDQEMVALSGAHALGRCHADRSGFDGPWTFSPTTLTNDYFKLLIDEQWAWKKWDGPKQFEDVKTKSLMMLPTDMALVKDKKFRHHVERYAKDNDVFFKEFADAVTKLFELGVPFSAGEEQRWVFKSSFD